MQVCDFRNMVQTAIPKANIQYVVCQDNAATASEPSLSSTGTINGNCQNNGVDTMVKVVWQIQVDQNDQASGANNGSATYTHMSRITQ